MDMRARRSRAIDGERQQLPDKSPARDDLPGSSARTEESKNWYPISLPFATTNHSCHTSFLEVSLGAHLVWACFPVVLGLFVLVHFNLTSKYH